MCSLTLLVATGFGLVTLLLVSPAAAQTPTPVQPKSRSAYTPEPVPSYPSRPRYTQRSYAEFRGATECTIPPGGKLACNNGYRR
jgi:hypothetical protein